MSEAKRNNSQFSNSMAISRVATRSEPVSLTTPQMPLTLAPLLMEVGSPTGGDPYNAIGSQASVTSRVRHR